MDVAVTGAGSAVGRAAVEALVASPAVDRVLALDAVEIAVPAGVTAGVVDARDPAIAERLAGVDVLVHLDVGDDPTASDAAMHDRNVGGSRTVVDAAVARGVRRIVVVTAASVYGARADNDVPLSESSPRQAPVDAPGARHVAEVERWLWERATTLPDGVALAVLRPAALVGPGVDGPVQRLVGLPRVPVVAGHRPPVQLVHVDDLAQAVLLAATTSMQGAYNVACPGWVSVDEAVAVVGRRTFVVPEEVARTVADASWRAGAGSGRGSRIDYLMHPCVVDVHRLQEAGWSSRRSNRDALETLREAHGEELRIGTWRVSRDRAGLAAGGVLAGLLLGALALRRVGE